MKKLMFLFILLFCGCYNYDELNTLAIATGMAIDYKEEYVVSLLIANSKPQQASSIEGQAKSVVYEGRGATISEALSDIGSITPKKIYIGHLSFIIISEHVAKKGVEDTIDYLLREPESTKRFYFIGTKDCDAKEILKIVNPLESFPSQSISIAISFSKETNTVTSTIPYSSFVERLLQKGYEPTLPTIELVGDEKEGDNSSSLEDVSPKTYIKLSTLMLFKEDKLVSIADEEESKGINLINNNTDKLLIEIPCENDKMTITLSNIHTNKKIKDKKNFYIKVAAKGAITENNCNMNLKSEKQIKQIEKQVEEKVSEYINSAYDKAKQNKTDIFGFGNLLYKKYKNEFLKQEKSWNEDAFLNTTLKTNIHVDLKYKGSLLSSIKEES